MGFLWASIRRKFNMCRMIPINSQTYRTSSSIEIAMVILSLATTDSFQIVRIQRFVTFCDQLRSAGRHVVFIFIDLLCLLHAPFALYCTSTLHCFSIKFWFVLLLKWVASIDDDEHVLLAALLNSLLCWLFVVLNVTTSSSSSSSSSSLMMLLLLVTTVLHYFCWQHVINRLCDIGLSCPITGYSAVSYISHTEKKSNRSYRTSLLYSGRTAKLSVTATVVSTT